VSFQIPNFPCEHTAFLADPTLSPLPLSDVNVEACRNPSHTQFDWAGCRAFKNEEPQDEEMRNLFLISGHKSAVLELTADMLVQATRLELRIANEQKIDGLGLTLSVLCIDFDRFAQEGKGT
jgi:hypothetical protein